MKSYQRDRSLPDPQREPTISVLRAGQILGMSRNTAYAAAKDGRLPTVAISANRVVVLTAEFLTRYRLTTSDTGTTASARRSPARAVPAPRVHAQWQLSGDRPRHLLLSSTTWPPLPAEQRERVARAAADAIEAAIGQALGETGVAS
jgi:hypothetical protein